MFGLRPRKILSLGIDIVHGCQLRCIGCPNATLKPNIQHMPHEVFEACLGNLDVACVKRLRLFNFGEPMFHPDLPGILRLIPKQRFRVEDVQLSTNAQVHRFDMLAEALKTGVLNTLAVSCDGDGTPEEYERLRPPARWDRLLEFMAKAQELRRAYSPATKLLTRTICQTEEGRRRWTETLVPLGFTPSFRGWQDLVGSVKGSDGKTKAIPEGLCVYLQRKMLYVDFDCTVVPCCRHPMAGRLGNLKESTYSQIMSGQARQAFVRELKNNRRGMAICGQCDARRHEHKIEKILHRSHSRRHGSHSAEDLG
jgi:MoaA/NifB/PqqE/SkfB family radical SAM enzyme